MPPLTCAHLWCSKQSNGIFKSANDDREYRYVELPNKIRAMLVQDASCDKASAAMCVKVGHFSDPDDVPGLAHFCEVSQAPQICSCAQP